MQQCKMIFCGDFAPNTQSNEYDSNTNLLAELKDIISEHDQAFVNIEVPLTNANKTSIKNGPNLKADPSFILPLTSVGFNLFGLANNHIMDFGWEGLRDTINLCKNNNISYVGAGSNLKESKAVHYNEMDGIVVATIAVAEREFSIATNKTPGVAPLDVTENYYQIKEAKDSADVVVVTMHAGNEHFPLPRPNLRKMCQLYIDMGADIIINHHSHIPSAYEKYKNKYIYYGLGNFLFNISNKNKSWYEGYMISLTIRKNENIQLESELIPYEQGQGERPVSLLKGTKLVAFKRNITELNDILNDEEAYNNKWNSFCLSRKNQYLLASFFPYTFRGIGVLEKAFSLSNLILNKRTIPVKLNMIECQSHREVLINLLKNGK